MSQWTSHHARSALRGPFVSHVLCHAGISAYHLQVIYFSTSSQKPLYCFVWGPYIALHCQPFWNLQVSQVCSLLPALPCISIVMHFHYSWYGLWTYLSFFLLFTNPEAWFLFLTTSRWFAVRLDAICAIFVIVVAFGSLILAKSKCRCE